MSNALAVYERVKDPIEFSKSHSLALASLLGCNEHQGQAAALTCLCEGLTPVEFVRRYHLIQGKPSMRADAMLAEFRMNFSGDYEIVERTGVRAAIKLVRNGKEYVAEFTWSEAQQSRWPWKDWQNHDKGLKDNWATPIDQRNMLWARLISDSFRAFCPELVAGVYTPEEMGDVVNCDVLSVQSVPMTASEFQASQISVLEHPVATVATEETATPIASTRLVDVARELFGELFGDKAPAAMDAALNSRNVNTLNSLDDQQLNELIDKLKAKKQQSGN